MNEGRYIPFSRFQVITIVSTCHLSHRQPRVSREKAIDKPECKGRRRQIPFCHSSKTSKARNSRNEEERLEHEALKNQQSTVRNL